MKQTYMGIKKDSCIYEVTLRKIFQTHTSVQVSYIVFFSCDHMWKVEG